MLYGVDALLATLRSSVGTDVARTFVTVIAFSTHAKIMAKGIPLLDFTIPEIKGGGYTIFADMMEILLQTATEDTASANCPP